MFYTWLMEIIHNHNDTIKWKHFPCYWPFVWGIHRSPVNSPHKGQWRGALIFSLICAWINGWVNNREAGDLRRDHAHYDITIMMIYIPWIMYTVCALLCFVVVWYHPVLPISFQGDFSGTASLWWYNSHIWMNFLCINIFEKKAFLKHWD